MFSQVCVPSNKFHVFPVKVFVVNRLNKYFKQLNFLFRINCSPDIVFVRGGVAVTPPNGNIKIQAE